MHTELNEQRHSQTHWQHQTIKVKRFSSRQNTPERKKLDKKKRYDKFKEKIFMTETAKLSVS
jgi:hypothetical protein